MGEVDEVVTEHKDIKDTRYNAEGDIEALVVWTALPEYNSTWERIKDLI